MTSTSILEGKIKGYYRFAIGNKKIIEVAIFTNELRDQEIAARGLLAHIRGDIPGTKEWHETQLEKWLEKEQDYDGKK